MKVSSQVCAVLLAASANARVIGWDDNSGLHVRQAPSTPSVPVPTAANTPAPKPTAAVTPAPKAAPKATSTATKSGGRGLHLPNPLNPAEIVAEQAGAIADVFSGLAHEAEKQATKRSSQLSGVSTGISSFFHKTKAEAAATPKPKATGEAAAAHKPKATPTEAVATNKPVSYSSLGTATLGKDGVATLTVVAPPPSATSGSGRKAGGAKALLDPLGLAGPGLLGINGEHGLIGGIAQGRSSPTPNPAKSGSEASPTEKGSASEAKSTAASTKAHRNAKPTASAASAANTAVAKSSALGHGHGAKSIASSAKGSPNATASSAKASSAKASSAKASAAP